MRGLIFRAGVLELFGLLDTSPWWLRRSQRAGLQRVEGGGRRCRSWNVSSGSGLKYKSHSE